MANAVNLAELASGTLLLDTNILIYHLKAVLPPELKANWRWPCLLAELV